MTVWKVDAMMKVLLVTAREDVDFGLAREVEGACDPGALDFVVLTYESLANELKDVGLVDLVVMDVSDTPEKELERLRLLRRRIPDCLIIVPTPPGTEQQLMEVEGVTAIEVPEDHAAFARAVAKALKGEARAVISGTHIGHFLQLISNDKKTCSIVIRSEQGSGALLFHEGVLFDAVCDDLRGNEAALAVLSWEEEPKTELRKLYSIPKLLVTEPVDMLVVESCRLRDERERMLDFAAVEIDLDDIADDAISEVDFLLDQLTQVGQARMAALIRDDGSVIAHRAGGDKLAALISYVAVESGRIRALMAWQGPNHITVGFDSGDKVVIFPADGFTAGVLVKKASFDAELPGKLWPFVRDADVAREVAPA